jgi:hypothetical protein
VPGGGPLKWVFELIDRLSGPATRMNRALEGVNKKLERANVSSSATQKVLKNLGGEVTGMGGRLGRVLGPLGLGVAGVLALGTAAVGAVYGVYSIGKAFAETAVEALAFKETTLETFKAILGNVPDAKDLFNTAVGFGKLTPFETKDVVTAFSELLSAGFSKQEVPIVFQALGDVSALGGFDKGSIGAITTQLAQMKGKGKALLDDVKPIVNASAKAGVGYKQIFEQIGKIKGVGAAAVPAMMTAGQISADTFTYAFLAAVKARGGGKLGNIMLKQSQTVTGLFSTLKSAATDVFLGIDFSQLPGWDTFKSVLSNISELINKLGPRAQTFVTKVINEGAEALLGWASGTKGMAKLEGIFSTLMDLAEGFWTITKGLIAAFQAFWEAAKPGVDELLRGFDMGGKGATSFADVLVFLGTMAGTAITALVYLLKLPSLLDDAFKEAGSWLWNAGEAIVQGLLDGIGSLAGKAVGTIFNLGVEMGQRFRAALGIHSPSAVFEEFGRYTALGYAQGVEREQPAVDTALLGLSGTAPGAGGRGGARASVTLGPGAVTIQVDARGADGEGIVKKLSELMPSALARALEQLGLEAGMLGVADG